MIAPSIPEFSAAAAVMMMMMTLMLLVAKTTSLVSHTLERRTINQFTILSNSAASIPSDCRSRNAHNRPGPVSAPLAAELGFSTLQSSSCS